MHALSHAGCAAAGFAIVEPHVNYALGDIDECGRQASNLTIRTNHLASILRVEQWRRNEGHDRRSFRSTLFLFVLLCCHAAQYQYIYYFRDGFRGRYVGLSTLLFDIFNS